MQFNNVSILGLAHVDAPIRVTSAEIDRQLAPALAGIGMRPGLLKGLSGIVARRYFEEGVSPSDAATRAAEKVIEQSGIDRSKIGVCVNTSVCKDYLEPSTACLVHSKLGLSPDCMNFDVGNACLAFLTGMETVAALIERGAIDYGLVVDGENSRQVTAATIERLLQPGTTSQSYREQFAALTLGSASAAMLLTRSDLAPQGHQFKGCTAVAATQWSHLCRGRDDYMYTDTANLLSQGVSLAKRTWAKGAKERNWRIGDFDEFVLHQVSKVHTINLTRALGIPIDKCLQVFGEYGNMGPAAVPVTLSKAVQAGRIKRGNRVALMGIGSGLNCAMAEIVW
ncbi:MAG: 3-oxoacyl-ACP synthase III [Myxococcales bacterium]|nr:3-oxoacyl-ACP synthase III [Myxococcales bacterium]